MLNEDRLRVVPHFSSGIVERAKRERSWKSRHARRGDTRWGERKMKWSFFSLPPRVAFSRLLFFSITRSSSFSVFHVRCKRKNIITPKKTRLCCCFYFLKVRAAMWFLANKTFSCIWVAILLLELFYIGMPVVRTDGRSLARSLYGHVITKIFSDG